MPSLSDEIARVQNAVAKLDTGVALPVVNRFDTLAPLLRQIAELVHTVDLLHLRNVPIRSLSAIADQIDGSEGPLECINGFIVPSYPVEDAVGTTGVIPSYDLARNHSNINRWCRKVENVHHNLFQLIGPIVAQQQLRLEALTSAVPMELDRYQSIAASNETRSIWRYLPLRNLLRCESECGIWLLGRRAATDSRWMSLPSCRAPTGLTQKIVMVQPERL
jgi:hypothetical protein